MREGVTGIIVAMLLGAGLAWAPPPAQEQASAPAGQEQPPGGGSALARPAAAVTTITPETIDCHPVRSDGTCTAGVTLRSTKDGIGKQMRLAAVLATPDGTPVNGVVVKLTCPACAGDVITIPAAPAIPLQLTLELPDEWRSALAPRVASGIAGFVPAGGTLFDGAPKRLRVLAPSPSEWQTGVLAVSGLLALLVALSLAVRLGMNGVALTDRMGAPSWKAGESWAANLTVGAALVNGVIALGVIADFTVFMTKPAYGVVSMLLASLVLLAPIVYGLARRKVTATRGGATVEEHEGFVAIVILASVLVLWASAGQLMTFGLLILEVWRAGALGGGVSGVIVALTAAILAALLVYGHFALFETLRDARKPDPAAKTTKAAGREAIGTAKAAPAWTLP